MVDNSVLAMMLGVSLSLAGVILFIVLWGVKSGQFDDGEKMMNGVLFDGEDELNDAAKREEKVKSKDKSSK